MACVVAVSTIPSPAISAFRVLRPPLWPHAPRCPKSCAGCASAIISPSCSFAGGPWPCALNECSSLPMPPPVHVAPTSMFLTCCSCCVFADLSSVLWTGHVSAAHSALCRTKMLCSCRRFLSLKGRQQCFVLAPCFRCELWRSPLEAHGRTQHRECCIPRLWCHPLAVDLEALGVGGTADDAGLFWVHAESVLPEAVLQDVQGALQVLWVLPTSICLTVYDGEAGGSMGSPWVWRRHFPTRAEMRTGSPPSRGMPLTCGPPPCAFLPHRPNWFGPPSQTPSAGLA